MPTSENLYFISHDQSLSKEILLGDFAFSHRHLEEKYRQLKKVLCQHGRVVELHSTLWMLYSTHKSEEIRNSIRQNVPGEYEVFVIESTGFVANAFPPTIKAIHKVCGNEGITGEPSAQHTRQKPDAPDIAELARRKRPYNSGQEIVYNVTKCRFCGKPAMSESDVCYEHNTE